MIGREMIDSLEGVESLENRFSEITADRTSIEDAKTFWNRVFYGENEEISDEKLWDEIVYRDESEFDFSDVVDHDTKKVLEIFTADEWESLDADGRYELISKLAERIGDSLGLEKIPEIELVDSDDNCYGFYNERENYIGINVKYWDDYKEVVDTLGHEFRHAYQRFRADKLETVQDKIYKFNFDHYILPEFDAEGKYINYKEYYEQYIEVEARAFAKEYAAEVA